MLSLQRGKNAEKTTVRRPSTPRAEKYRLHNAEFPEPRPTPPACFRYPLRSIARRFGFKIRFVAYVVLDWNSKKKRRCDVPIFALNRGRPDERYEAKTQQSTIYSFEYASWARVAAFLEGSASCGSLTSTSRQRHILNILLVFFTWLIVAIMRYPAVQMRRS